MGHAPMMRALATLIALVVGIFSPVVRGLMKNPRRDIYQEPQVYNRKRL